MIQDQLTLMLIPEKNGKVLRLSLSNFTLKVLLVTGALLLAVTFLILLDYIFLTGQRWDQQEMETQTHHLEFKIQQTKLEMAQMAKELNKFEEFDKKLRIIGGFTETMREASQRRKELAQQELRSLDDVELLADIKELDMDMQLRLASLFQLETYLQDQEDRLMRTPSIAPTTGNISSTYGIREDPFTKRRKAHKGLDYANIPFTPVYAPADGIITNTYTNGGYGQFLVVDHGYGIITRYGHLAKFEISVGQRVKRGDLIGRMGNTGRSSGTHLHYEVLVRDEHVDPELYILNVE